MAGTDRKDSIFGTLHIQDTLRETHDEEASFDPETSSIYRLMTTALGERLVPHYGDGSLATWATLQIF